MNNITKFAMATAFAALAACGGSNSAKTTDMNAADMNASMTAMNTTGNAEMNSTSGNATSSMGGTTNNSM